MFKFLNKKREDETGADRLKFAALAAPIVGALGWAGVIAMSAVIVPRVKQDVEDTPEPDEE